MKTNAILKLGIFDNPVKVLWSEFHGLFIVLGKRVLYTYDGSTQEQKSVYGSETMDFTDMAVSAEGYVIILMKDSSGVNSAKQFKPDFFSLVFNLALDEETLRAAIFTSAGMALVCSEKNFSDCDAGLATTSTVFRLVQQDGGTREMKACMSGSVISLVHDADSGRSFAVNSGGEIWSVPNSIEEEQYSSSSEAYIHNNLYKAGSIDSGAVSAVEGLRKAVTSETKQEKVRVYVGSQEWLNDMWDSGEISSSASTMPYGGGDNLKPGHRYWVHIMTYHSDSGWSKPQIRSFVMPKE